MLARLLLPAPIFWKAACSAERSRTLQVSVLRHSRRLHLVPDTTCTLSSHSYCRHSKRHSDAPVGGDAHPASQLGLMSMSMHAVLHKAVCRHSPVLKWQQEGTGL